MSLDFPMRSVAPSATDERGLSRFPFAVLGRVRGVSDRAGSDHASRWRRCRHGLPLPSTASAPRSGSVQALLVGRPVGAFDCDGAREVVIDGVTGQLVPPKSIQGLRAAITEILQRPDRGRYMGEEGRRRCMPLFDWWRRAEQLHAIYQRFLPRQDGAAA